MSTVRINQLSAHAETDQNSVPFASIPHIVHHIWFSTPLPKKIVFPDDEDDRGDIFEKLKEEHNANLHLSDFRLILWTNGADNLDLKKFIDDNELKKIEIHDYNSLRLEPECLSLDETDEEIMKFMTEELSHPAGNPGAASDMFRLIILKHLGGFYSDVNDEPPYIFNDSQALIPSFGCWVGGDDDGACNNLLAAVKNHQLVRDTLDIIANNYK
jgi:mannosyltransferase OCH1-like enzyme